MRLTRVDNYAGEVGEEGDGKCYLLYKNEGKKRVTKDRNALYLRNLCPKSCQGNTVRRAQVQVWKLATWT